MLHDHLWLPGPRSIDLKQIQWLGILIRLIHWTGPFLSEDVGCGIGLLYLMQKRNIPLPQRYWPRPDYLRKISNHYFGGSLVGAGPFFCWENDGCRHRVLGWGMGGLDLPQHTKLLTNLCLTNLWFLFCHLGPKMLHIKEPFFSFSTFQKNRTFRSYSQEPNGASFLWHSQPHSPLGAGIKQEGFSFIL